MSYVGEFLGLLFGSGSQKKQAIPLWYGNGVDGSVTFDGTTTILGIVPSSNIYTLDKDIVLSSSTINSGVTIITNGYRIYCNGTLTNNGTIHNNGTDATSSTGESGLPSNVIGGSAAGGNGAILTPNVGEDSSSGISGNGGAGGSGSSGAGAAGGTTQAIADFYGSPYVFQTFTEGSMQLAGGTVLLGGSGGGGGNGDGVNAGGGGGSGGSIVFICAYTIEGTGTISANGGNGANASAGNSGGGGGGGGGIVIITSFSVSSGSIAGQTISADGGSGGTGVGTGTNGTAGDAGTLILNAA